MNATQIILIVVIVLMIILYPVMASARTKKERQRMEEQTNSLKRGDKVITASGIYGTIVDLHQEGNNKIVTIETGTGKHKSYVSVDSYAIYSIENEESKTEESSTKDANQPQSTQINEEEKAEAPEVVESNKAEETSSNKGSKKKKESK